jgi:outer membrane receptor protein involved in Fe transport
MTRLGWLCAPLVAVAMATATASAQDASISGRVTDPDGAPVGVATVRIVSLAAGTTTGADGTYRLVIPANRLRSGQTVALSVSRQGMTATTRSVTLSPGANLTQNFTLAVGAVLLEDLVVTGTAGPTSREKVPFTVATVRAEDIPVAATSAAGSIQGKVAGATVTSSTGRPGAPPTILLRAPTSINASGRSQEPLYIVDGVVMSSGVVDIDALDIESIEVVKGAAGASMYGSRAGASVIQIRTRRGANATNN